MKTMHTRIATAITAIALVAASMNATAAETQGEQAVVNINTATVSELAYLPGIGPSKAEKIARYREARPFKKVEDILRVKGIGRKTFKKMKPFLSVDGPTTARSRIQLPKSD